MATGCEDIRDYEELAAREERRSDKELSQERFREMETASTTYSIGTWDTDKQAYTPQRGLTVPSFNCTLAQLRQAIRDLHRLGYSAHRFRDPDGSHNDNDWAVLIERTDGRHWKEIRKGWRR